MRRGIAAADPQLLPAGSVVSLATGDPEFDGVYTVMDTGPAVQGRLLDLYVWSCHEALAFGRSRSRSPCCAWAGIRAPAPPSLVDRLFRRQNVRRAPRERRAVGRRAADAEPTAPPPGESLPAVSGEEPPPPVIPPAEAAVGSAGDPRGAQLKTPTRASDTQSMHIRALVLVCLASTMFAARAEAQFQASNPAPGENYHVEFGVMFWTPQPGIVILSGSLAPLATAGVDFVREFNLENERFMEFRSVLKGGKHKLRVSRVPFKYEQDRGAAAPGGVRRPGVPRQHQRHRRPDVGPVALRLRVRLRHGRRRLLRLHRRGEAATMSSPTCAGTGAVDAAAR